MHPRQLLALTLLLGAATAVLLTGWVSPAAGLSTSVRGPGWAERRWSWPVAPVPSVLRPYRAPLTEYAAGHRGIDVAVPTGTSVSSPDDGVVFFAGMVGGRPILSVEHGDGLVSSFEPLVAVVVAGQPVRRGDLLGTVAPSAGHCPIDCLHLGTRVDGRYVSPMVLLGDVPRAILLPLTASRDQSGARVSLFVRPLEPLG
jgi:murein DD-endopeptidase MepM/ murein hydrolase activator NlpD